MKKQHLPPYAALADKLRRKIREDHLEPGSWIGTEVELAKGGGVSRMTARRAVQSLVDEGLAERRAGRGVFVRGTNSTTRHVRYIAGNLLWTPAVRVGQAVQAAARASGIAVSVVDGMGDLGTVVKALNELPGSGYGGAIIMSQHDTSFNRALSALVAANYPFVVVDQTLSDIPAPSIAADNRAGGRMAAQELLDAGHRRLAFFGDRADTSLARALGAAEACAAAGVPPPIDLTAVGAMFDNWEPTLAPILRSALSVPNRPTGLVCSCDNVARIALRAIAATGLAVPRDVSVVGFDDDPIAEWTSPPLTTVRQDFAAMGTKALHALEALFGAPSPVEAATDPVLIPVSMVRRNSVAPPSA